MVAYKTSRKVIAYSIVVFSAVIAINVLLQNMHSVIGGIAAVVVVIGLKSAEVFSASDAVEHYKRDETWRGSAFLLLASLLFFLSVSGSTLFWFSNHKKDVAKLDTAKQVLATKQADVETARAQLAGCNPKHVTKCVKPMTEVLTAKQAERDKAQAELQNLTDAAGNTQAWAEYAAFFGIPAASMEIGRDLILSALADLIAIIFIAQATSSENNEKSEKKRSSQASQSVADNAQPLRIAGSQPVSVVKSLSSVFGDLDDMEEVEVPRDLLADIKPLQRMLIVGGQNAGKTTLLKHIAAAKSQQGGVLILDSHNYVGKWEEAYRVVGHGRDYAAIETELKKLVSLMDKRYKEYATGEIGERQHELITVISDEWTTIAENINSLDQLLTPLLTESRKVGIDFIVACHSETAGSLGLKGRFDLKKNFDAVLRLQNSGGVRTVKLDNWESVTEYHHPGAYQEREVSILKGSQVFDDIISQTISPENVEEIAILDAHAELADDKGNFSKRQLSQKVWGAGKFGGPYNAIIDRVLEKHGRIA